MGLDDLPVAILPTDRYGCRAALPGRSRRKCCRVFTAVQAQTPRLDADHTNRCVVDEWMEQSDGIRPAADAGDERIRQTPGLLQTLRTGFVADDRLKVAHHHRIRMRAGDGTDDVVRVIDVRDPVAQRFVHRVFERASIPMSTGTTSAPSNFMR